MKRLIALMLLADVFRGNLTACNTMAGAGKDVQKAGEEVEDAANKDDRHLIRTLTASCAEGPDVSGLFVCRCMISRMPRCAHIHSVSRRQLTRS